MLGFKESFVVAASFHNKSLKSKTLKSMAFFLQRGKNVKNIPKNIVEGTKAFNKNLSKLKLK